MKTLRRWYFLGSVLLGIAVENARRRYRERRTAADLGTGDTSLHAQLDRLWRG